MALSFANNASTTLAANIAYSDTTLTVATGDGALFPDPATDGPFRITVVSAVSGVLEIMECTARSGDTLTVARGKEGTPSYGFLAGDTVENRITAETLGVFAQTVSPTTPGSIATLDSTGNIAGEIDPGSITTAYATVSDMKAAPISAGVLVRTKGYYAAGDGGQATYLVKTATDYGAAPDEYGDHTLANGNVAVLQHDGAVNVKQFGAKGDGIADDTEAIQAAINAGNSIYLPPGTYTLTAVLVASNKPISIVGAGIGVSVFRWVSPATTSGISITQNDDAQYVSINGLSFLTELTAAGTAITIDLSGQISSGVIQSRTAPRLRINNVRVAGATATNVDGWSRGIELVSPIHGIIDGFHFEGMWQTTQDNILSAEAVKYSGAGSPVELVLVNSQAFYASSALHATDCEGVFVDNCSFTAVTKGVTFDPASLEPQLSLKNTHINAYGINVDISNLVQGDISGNLFYVRPDATADVAGVKMVDSIHCNIHDNTFVNNSGYDYNAIVLSGACARNKIQGNIFANATTAVWIQSSSCTENVITVDNVYGTVTNRLVDSGGNTRQESGFCTLRNSVTRDIADSTLTALPFDGVYQGDSRYWDALDPTKLTAPFSGRYRVSGMCVFDINPTGYRRALIRKNGVANIGLPQQTVSANGATNDVISLGSDIVELDAGDYVELYVMQNSGATMTLPLAGTYLKIEYVAEKL